MRFWIIAAVSASDITNFESKIVRNTDYFKNKKIIIAGFARSGLACANLLYDLGARVSVTDNQDSDATRLNASKLKSKNIEVD